MKPPAETLRTQRSEEDFIKATRDLRGRAGGPWLRSAGKKLVSHSIGERGSGSDAGSDSRIGHAEFFELSQALGVLLLGFGRHAVGVGQQIRVAVTLRDLAQVLGLRELMIAVALIDEKLLLFVQRTGGIVHTARMCRRQAIFVLVQVAVAPLMVAPIGVIVVPAVTASLLAGATFILVPPSVSVFGILATAMQTASVVASNARPVSAAMTAAAMAPTRPVGHKRAICKESHDRHKRRCKWEPAHRCLLHKVE